MKQIEPMNKNRENKWHIAKVVACNFTRVIIAWSYYLITGLLIKAKRLHRGACSILKGYSSYTDMIQSKLDHNHRIYTGEKHHEGCFYNGKFHTWNEMKRY